MQNYSYNIYIDISGRKKETQYFGLISINSNQLHNFTKAFNKEFPGFLRKKTKGTDLTENEIDSVLKFFETQNIIFTSTYISHDEKLELKKKYINKAYFYERLVGSTYYRILERVTNKNSSINYNIFLCEDNQINSKKARNYTRYLLKSNKRNTTLTAGLNRDIPEIKFSDIIASAHKKLGFSKLKNYKNYKNCPPKIDEQILTRVFEK